MRNRIAVICSFFLITVAVAHNYRPPNGHVPDSSTAIRVAEAVLSPVYGEKQVESERPFIANLKNDVWIVFGTLHCQDGKTECHGGVAEVQISKTDAHIISMTHGK